jgi:transcriptional regulator with XRE-family HTH domain
MAGRPTKYTPELARDIVRTLASGVPKRYAAEANGVSKTTLNEWENGRGGIPKSEIQEFQAAIARASAQAVIARVARIAKAGIDGDWKADAWYLEHVHSDDFAGREKHEHSGPEGAPFVVRLEVVE